MYPILVPSKKDADNPPEVHRITFDEKQACDAFVTYGSYQAAAELLGVGANVVMKRATTEASKIYIMRRSAQAANAVALTPEKILATINACIDGSVVLTPSQIRALDLGAKVTKLIQTNVNHTQNIQNNTYWQGKSSDEMDKAIRERLDSIEISKVEYTPDQPGDATA